MKNLFKAIAILCLILGVIFTVCSCGEEETPEPTPSNPESPTSSSTTDSKVEDNEGSGDKEPEMVDYKVMVVDAFGNNISAVVEMFMNGESLGEMPTRQGVATFKQEKGDYTFKPD